MRAKCLLVTLDREVFYSSSFCGVYDEKGILECKIVTFTSYADELTGNGGYKIIDIFWLTNH